MKILVAADGSKYSTWTVDFLKKLPFSCPVEIILLHVVELPTHRVPLTVNLEARRRHITTIREKRFAAAKKFLKPLEKSLLERFREVRVETAEGNAADGIIKLAGESAADLIVVGSRGLTPIRVFLLGGVSQRVVTYSPCSVLVVKKRVSSLRRIMVAVDSSSYSDASIDFLKKNISPEGLDVTVLNVWDYGLEMPEEAGFIKEYSDGLTLAGFDADTLSLKGNAAKRIIDTTRRKRANLVVVGAKGLAASRLFLLGRTARKVVTYCASSVLVLREKS